ncbi:relaxase domain-containing protein (plasmid) [Kitasatospora sp. NBC_01246]|uniref:MobF family relaxase n=1 Tax=Kitasatospora sp. NBC_01246 TaxID=2903570 RepID=UPI002E37AB32|nr:MobF family relaxase [Kitasatospora sp. NBC_01246]
MMTVHRLSAGDGYVYYMRETVSADAQRERGQELGDYYTAKGQPPGLWMGSGAALLGVSGTVTEAQMKALYGEGLHPDAERIIAERLAAGDHATRAVAAAKLGRKFPTFKGPDNPFSRLLEEELDAFARIEQRPPSPAERAAVRGKVGARLFREEHGRGPATKEELGRFIKKAEGGKQRAAVAGFDLVFSAPKSVSVLWALGDEDVRRAVERAHEKAMADTLAWLEAEATMTRTGTGGIAQEHVEGGLIAARFRHYDSRLGEPLLHDHLVIANKVKGRDGKWRSLDSALLYAQNVPASELYNARVVEEVCAELGLRAEAREVTSGKRAVMEIAGVGHDLIEANSGRSTSIKERTAELVEEYRATTGHEPSSKVLTQLMQRATLDTRPDKKEARSLADLRTQWRETAVAEFGADRVDRLLWHARAVAERLRIIEPAPAAIDIEQAAREVITTVAEHRSVWGERQVLAEARRWVMQTTRGAVTGTDLAEQITARALAADSINITPPDPNPTFAPLTRDDGTSIYRRRETTLYTSAAVLAAEDRIVAAARTRVIPPVSAEVYDRAEAAYQQANPQRPLDAGQRALARTFATGEHLVQAAIGPAGAGKTTAMALAAEAVRASGGRVIGLGPSARAAAELAGGIEASSYVLHEWLAAREGAHEGRRVRAGFELYSGDMVIVDEAGMAGSKRLVDVITDAERAGAVVRLVGDPGQLASVESGGALRLLANVVDVVELEAVHRFRTEGEAAASLALRSGEPEEAWAWYLQQGRIVAGSREQMVHQIFTDWQRDIEAGHTGMMMAGDNATVAELNEKAQAYRAGAGQLDLSRGVDLRDGLEAHRGDLVVTRRNARRNVVRGGKDFVKNGDQWSVVEVREDGSLLVRHASHGGRATLPADYVSKHVEIGYASTGHRGQGATVGMGGGLFDASTARESAYVEMTRGSRENRGYVILEDGQTMADVLQSIARNSQASRSATETIRDEQDRAWNIGRLANEYTDVHARAMGLRYQSMARSQLGLAAEAFIAADAWPAVERALRDAERAGFAPEPILKAAYTERGFSDTEDNSAVLSWRIDNHVSTAQETLQRLEEQPSSRPLRDLTDVQVAKLADESTKRRRAALEEVRRAEARVASQPRPVDVGDLTVPAWPHREYGDLTRAQLAAAIGEARQAVRLTASAHPAETPGEAAERTWQHRAESVHLATLRSEQRLRAEMSRRDRAREDWQREPAPGHASTAGLDAATMSAAMRANEATEQEAHRALDRADAIEQRVRAEQRLRQLLPEIVDTTPDHQGPVPEWLAPRETERDQHTPSSWNAHLAERREVIEARLLQTGQALAQDPPAWARTLGPVPLPDTELRETWERTAALADAWRTRRQVRDTEPGIGDRPAADRDAEAWQILADQVAQVGRRARATEAAVQRGEALARAQAELDRDVPTAAVEAEPVALAVAEYEPVELAVDQAVPELAADVAEEPAERTAPAVELVEDELQAPAADVAEPVELAVDQAVPELAADVAEEPAERTAPAVELVEDELQAPAADVAEPVELAVDQAVPELAADVAEEPAERTAPAVELVEDELQAPAADVAEPVELAVDQAVPELAADVAKEPAERTAPAVDEWESLPYGELSDGELSDMLAYTTDAADTALQQAVAQEARAAELAAALAPGGEIEQRVAARAERVEAIEESRTAAAAVDRLTTELGQAQHQAAAVEARLAETTRLGRPAVRGADREALEQQLLDLRATAQHRDQELTATRQRLEDSTRTAGSPAEHEDVLAAWQRAGGSREAALERAKASRTRGLQASQAEALAARGRATELDGAAAQIRQEMNRRDAQPYAARIAEDAQRIQAAQLAAEQQRQQNQQQQPGPDVNRGQGRSGPEL